MLLQAGKWYRTRDGYFIVKVAAGAKGLFRLLWAPPCMEGNLYFSNGRYHVSQEYSYDLVEEVE